MAGDFSASAVRVPGRALSAASTTDPSLGAKTGRTALFEPFEEVMSNWRVATQQYEQFHTEVFRCFVFIHGRWFDSAFDIPIPERYQATGVPILPAFPVNQPLSMAMRGFLSVWGSDKDEPEKSELGTYETRLSFVEERLEQVAARLDELPHNYSNPTGGQTEEARGQGNDEPELMETPGVRAQIVKLESIASAVQSFAVKETAAWRLISEQYPGASLFAINADPRSFEVTEKGAFDGHASILVSVPRKLRSGRQSSLSLKINTRVFGQLSPKGDINISEFKL
jgi:hypothetical protein